jgi:hypothetical protein
LWIVALAVMLVSPVYFKRKYLRVRRTQTMENVTAFVSISQQFDSAVSAAISLVQEVELVSRGYRMYVSGMERQKHIETSLTSLQKRSATAD